MVMKVQNTKELLDPAKFKFKGLVYGLSSTGKTSWAASALDAGLSVGFIANETGQGRGLLSVANLGVDFVTPSSVKDLDEIFDGKVFADKDVIVWDSLSWAAKTFIKEYALKIPRLKGNTPKRDSGVPELDDYMVMGECTRRLLHKLLALDKHIIVVALERFKGPDPETGRGETIIGPDLPGEMFTGSTAMFDFVFRMRTRAKLANPQDAKSRYTQYYMLTGPDGAGSVAKCRANDRTRKPWLATEEVRDAEHGQFKHVLEKVVRGYAEEFQRDDKAARTAASVS